MKKLLLISFVILAGCTKIVQPIPQTIDLGTKATSTAIKHISQVGNTVTAEFQTTVGSKYSIQIIPFGSDEPIKTEGFTANDTTVQRVLNLSSLPKKDYDLIFIDVNGKEVKYPIIIK